MAMWSNILPMRHMPTTALRCGNWLIATPLLHLGKLLAEWPLESSCSQTCNKLWINVFRSVFPQQRVVLPKQSPPCLWFHGQTHWFPSEGVVPQITVFSPHVWLSSLCCLSKHHRPDLGVGVALCAWRNQLDALSCRSSGKIMTTGMLTVWPH